MTAIKLKQVSKSFQGGKGAAVLNALDLDIKEGESHVLLGPSGCGKTTTLRLIAGLDMPSDGTITIAGATMYSARERTWVPSEQRPIGMVFQSYALWPNMTVAQNVCFALTYGRARLGHEEAGRRVRDVLATMQIESLADRPVTQLSGGQQQRVALARAIAQRPKVLLMDEPLSNLDPQLRADVRGEIREITRQLGVTSVIVTHDRDDALALADRVSVMSAGRIVQQAQPCDMIRDPATLFVARLFGEINVLEGKVVSVSPGRLLIKADESEISVVSHAEIAPGSDVVIAMRPSRQRLAEEGLCGVVIESHREGELVRSQVRVGHAKFTLYHHDPPLRAGQIVHVASDDEAWMIYRK
ncbi:MULTISPECIES: ABC transporter ATP-binding protein [unclassified Beijerinckia]|uniref:ABC transporter ATP-binding protein n=1 Tax=unclassified Beijerinckia TaxID=2638183 RepID=UPI0008981A50|nr:MULTISPECIES: ABC transporter ATP-binding protein [unclassified Beijerinckia]MDH7798846.1 ABC-type Fe3+/spermidine/putrescine transport system ATPase subunit [Beijerinckia sp. GAS462]SED89144.1 putative spermidine/putrescine transport system ATP-binding protein/spermidine/putrescine transport system ATP-binding protein [Beijerinckia sp. 28-YEA-48]